MPSIEKLEKIIKKLQEIMRIQDWDIKIDIRDKYYIKELMKANDFDTVMCCERNYRKNNAIIFINEDHFFIPDNWYICLVHELYHIVTGEWEYITDRWDEETMRDISKTKYENLVEHLAKIFISIYPESKIKEDLI